MEKRAYLPEGSLLATAENQAATASLTALMRAQEENQLLEGKAIRCDVDHNLIVRLPCGEAIIPHNEGALGIAEGVTRDIALISRVGKPVCFVVIGFEQTGEGCRPILSRRLAQERCKEEFLNHLRPGDVIPARVTKLESYGAFCDVGCGLVALMLIADISVSRISHPSDRLTPGMEVLGVVSSLDNGRICLSHRELLGTWEENAALFSEGETVSGIVRSVESYGIFIELTPNLTGLAESRPGVKVGQSAAVFIKGIHPDKMKVKLVLIDAVDDNAPPPPFRYFIEEGPIRRWRYSPEGCQRTIERVFEE
ncbi:MAG: 30S ribosomal protein S1 [Clostridia bacterium]|nr:30S ribosomal protein S1 [Clostridia bacterium]